MKQVEVTMVLTVSDSTNESILVGSIADDAIRAYDEISEIQYEWCEVE